MIGFINNVRIERRIYWAAWLFATTLMACAFIDRGWHIFLAIVGVGLAAALTFAYFRTSYLKVGGRIYAYAIPRTRPDPSVDGSPAPSVIPPPDSYRGMVSAATHWWSLVFFSVVAGTVGLFLGVGEESIFLGAIAVVVFGLTGYIDARDGFPPARNQRVPAAVALIASIPVLLLPPIAYAIAYYIDRPRHRS